MRLQGTEPPVTTAQVDSYLSRGGSGIRTHTPVTAYAFQERSTPPMLVPPLCPTDFVLVSVHLALGQTAIKGRPHRVALPKRWMRESNSLGFEGLTYVPGKLLTKSLIHQEGGNGIRTHGA